MRAFSKTLSVIATVAAVALTASAADARSANTNRLGGAYNSVTTPSTPAPGSITYDAEGSPFPTGHGGTSGSSDFQLMR